MLLVTYGALLTLPSPSTAGNLLQKQKALTEWRMLEHLQQKGKRNAQTNSLVPGLPELGGGASINKFALKTGFEPHPIDKYHSGDPKRDTCQPWEDCAGQRISNISEITTTPQPTMNLSSSGNMTFFNASKLQKDSKSGESNVTVCREWDLTKNGCQCIDTCECNRGPTCKTVHIRTLSSTNQTLLEPCGNLDLTGGNFFDTCMPAMAPTEEPSITVVPPKRLKGNKNMYRDFNGPKNKRFLPKTSCFSKTFYCVKFPMFEGCVPGLTYKYSEDMENQVNECKLIEDQKTCEGKELCGKGKHGSCHHMCVWSEDSPGWFRKLRGEQNQWLKKYQRDPATIKSNRYLPVLQPAWEGNHIRSLQDGADDIVKKPTEKAHVDTTPPPPSHVRAGKVGNERSAGFPRAPQVGVNVGNDMTFSSEDDGVRTINEAVYDAHRVGD